MEIKFGFLHYDALLALSRGQVKRAVTISPRTGRPLRDGLFDPSIFGASRFYECACGHLRNAPIGAKCPRCGSTIESPEEQMRRLGHIPLAQPIPHPLFERVIAGLLGMSVNKYRTHMRTVHGSKYDQDGMSNIIARLSDLDPVTALAQATVKNSDAQALLYPFVKGYLRPSDLFLRALPVPAAVFRPVFRLKDRLWSYDPINHRYQAIIAANNRLARAIAHGYPPLIRANHAFILYEEIAALLNAWLDRLRGKYGWFRRSLLGRRADYTGRAVIVPDADLPIDACRLPYALVVKLYEPWLVRAMLRAGLAHNVAEARKTLARPNANVLDIVQSSLDRHLVLLNRSPTLHQLGLLAFRPLVWERDCIAIPPAVCAGYNADFDGDQMAALAVVAHETAHEARRLYVSSAHPARPSDGTPVWGPSKDFLMVFPPPLQRPPKGLLASLPSWMAEAVLSRAEQVVRLPSKQNWQSYLVALLSASAIETNPERAREWRLFYQHVCESIAADERAKRPVATSLSIADIDGPLVDDPQAHRLLAAFAQGRLSLAELENALSKSTSLAISRHHAAMFADSGPDAKLMVERGAAKGGIGSISVAVSGYGQLSDIVGNPVFPPVATGLIHGLTAEDYFRACHQQRRGLLEAIESTARSGHLSRRIMEAMQMVLVSDRPCDSPARLCVQPDALMPWVAAWMICAQPVEISAGIRLEAGDVVTPLHVELAMSAKKEVVVHSPLGCAAPPFSICPRCYGLLLSSLAHPKPGARVGVIATQAIGEPLTQAALRAFYSSAMTRAGSAVNRLAQAFTKPDRFADSAEGWAWRMMRALHENGQLAHFKHVALIARVLFSFSPPAGIERLAQMMRSPLARLSYQDARSEILRLVLYRSADPLRDIKARLMLGLSLSPLATPEHGMPELDEAFLRFSPPWSSCASA